MCQPCKESVSLDGQCTLNEVLNNFNSVFKPLSFLLNYNEDVSELWDDCVFVESFVERSEFSIKETLDHRLT